MLAEYLVRSGEAINRGLVDVRVRLVFEVSDDGFRLLIVMIARPLTYGNASSLECGEFNCRCLSADIRYSVNLPRPAKPSLLITRPGLAAHSGPSIAGVNSGHPRLESGAVGVAPWQQERWITDENCPRLWAD